MYHYKYLKYKAKYEAEYKQQQKTDESTNNIYSAILHKDIDSVVTLLDSGTDLNLKNSDGDTPLHFAIKHDKMDIIDILL